MASSSEEILHKITVPRGAWLLWRDLCVQGEWYKNSPKHFIPACEIPELPPITDSKMPEFKPPEASGFPFESAFNIAVNQAQAAWQKEVLLPWQSEEVSYEVTEEQRDCLKALTEHFVKAGGIRPGKSALRAVKALGLKFS